MWATGAYGYLLDYLLCWAIILSLLLHTWCFFKVFPGRKHPRAKLVIGNALIGLCMLAFVAVCAETYLRFVSVATDALGASLTSKRWHKVYAKLNSFYCRDDEWLEAAPPGVHRIAFLGDSFTYGVGVNNTEDRFTDLIKRNFERLQQPVEVLNVAWSGWHTGDQVWALRQFMPRLDIDEVVLCYLPNDIDKLIPVDEANPLTPPRNTYVNVESSFLLDYLYYRIVAPRTRAGPPYLDWLGAAFADPDIWAAHQKLLAELVEICKEQGYRVRVVLLPMLAPDSGLYKSDAIHLQLAAYLHSLGVEVLDLRPSIAGLDVADLTVNQFDPHPNETAHRIFATEIWQAFYAGT